MIESKLGAGEVFPLVGLPGTVVAPNITPEPTTGAGSWSDDQLARAIREGIGHDGRTLFPLMPYEHFRNMSDEDVASVVVYLRSLPPVQNLLPKTEIAFPVNFLIRSVPQPVTEPVPASNSTDPVKRGEYLVQMAGCSDCHTPQERGSPNQAWILLVASSCKDPLEPCSLQHHSGSFRHFILRRKFICSGDADRQGGSAITESDHALAHVPEYDR